MQSDVFLFGEADAYHERNHYKYARLIEKDLPLMLLDKTGIRPTRVLEIGCATGWRLAVINERYGAECHGVEPSPKAVIQGRKLYPGIMLRRGLLEDMYFNSSFDLIVLSFVLHWLDRSQLLSTLTTVDRMLCDGGYLAISDFLPDEPCKAPYHHKPGIWTYKDDYARMLPESLYQPIMRVTFNADTLELGSAPSHQRAAACLLQKGEYYQCE